MSITVEATYEDGVLKTKSLLPLQPHETVRIIIETTVSRVRQTAGFMGWTGSAELASRFALDTELVLDEGNE